MWAHKKVCKATVVTVPVSIPDTPPLPPPLPPEPDLREEIKVMIIELAKNQQPTAINNSIDNSLNNTNYINILLNDKCHNACDTRKFIAGIDFSNENFQNILKDCVGGNA